MSLSLADAIGASLGVLLLWLVYRGGRGGWA